MFITGVALNHKDFFLAEGHKVGVGTGEGEVDIKTVYYAVFSKSIVSVVQFHPLAVCILFAETCSELSEPVVQ